MLKQIDNITLLGTSHVSSSSVKEIQELVDKIKPEVIGIELDYQRLQSLLSKKKQKASMFQLIKEFGVFGAGFLSLASSMQKKMGKKLNILPGEDMKTAYLKARELNTPVALIDQNIKKTIKDLSSISALGKIKTVFNLLVKSFKKEYQVELNQSLGKGDVPTEKALLKILDIVKKEAPLLYKAIISNRDKHMAKRVLELKQNHTGPILIVVGAGHLAGMIKILEKEVSKNLASFTFTSEVENHLNLNL